MSIKSFTKLFEEAFNAETCVGPFIGGHLIIEFLLRKLIQIYDPALSRLADDLNHARLIQLNYDLGTIDDSQKETLVLINKTRNKFAHQITYEPTIEELKALFKSASLSFSDLSDGISQGLEVLEEAKSVNDLDEWVIPELFVQISYDLADEYNSRGGDLTG